jgi:DNA-binding MarR family transcriptional regulator
MPDTQRLRAARALLGSMPLVMRTIGRAMRMGAGDASPLLPQQYRLLGAIGRKPRTLGQIARIQGVTPATATTLVTTLESRGWVTREHDQEDRRKIVVSLTEDGAATLSASQRVAETAMADLLAPLDAEQLERLLNGLSVLGDLVGTESPE